MISKRALILHWVEQGLINPARARVVMSSEGVLPDSKRWSAFIENLLTWLGMLALGFAVLFFIAYNWQAMGRFAKFGLLEMAVIASLLVYWRIDADKLTARLSLLLASLFVGVLLAFYGQTYQTGADTWQLFANWALLILPWVLLARFATLWLLWLVLLNLSIVLYFTIRPGLFGLMFDSTAQSFWQIFFINTLAWIGWEVLAQRIVWLAVRWAIRLIAIASGSAISTLCLIAIFDDYQLASWVILAYLAWLGAVYFVYRTRIHDLFMLAGLCLSLIVVVTAWFGHVLREGSEPVGGFMLLTILVTGMASLATIWLKKLHREFVA